MNELNRPSVANGKICYLEIPATDVAASAKFYETVFDWAIRGDNAGNTSFDDTTGQVSGMWVTNRAPATQPGIVISIMVFDIAATLKKVLANGGKVVQAPDVVASEKIALFADPAGNVFCLYQHNV